MKRSSIAPVLALLAACSDGRPPTGEPQDGARAIGSRPPSRPALTVPAIPPTARQAPEEGRALAQEAARTEAALKAIAEEYGRHLDDPAQKQALRQRLLEQSAEHKRAVLALVKAMPANPDPPPYPPSARASAGSPRPSWKPVFRIPAP